MSTHLAGRAKKWLGEKLELQLQTSSETWKWQRILVPTAGALGGDLPGCQRKPGTACGFETRCYSG